MLCTLYVASERWSRPLQRLAYQFNLYQAGCVILAAIQGILSLCAKLPSWVKLLNLNHISQVWSCSLEPRCCSTLLKQSHTGRLMSKRLGQTSWLPLHTNSVGLPALDFSGAGESFRTENQMMLLLDSLPSTGIVDTLWSTLFATHHTVFILRSFLLACTSLAVFSLT